MNKTTMNVMDAPIFFAQNLFFILEIEYIFLNNSWHCIFHLENVVFKSAIVLGWDTGALPLVLDIFSLFEECGEADRKKVGSLAAVIVL